MTDKHARRYGIAWLTLLAATLVSATADASSICSGSVTGSVLAPLHKPIAVSLVTPINERPDPALARRFLDGVQAAGVSVVDTGQGNAVLDMTFSVSPTNNGGAGRAGGTYKGFGWMSGDTVTGQGAPDMRGSALALSIEVTDAASQSLAWIGSVNCTVRGDDPAALAEELGRVVGHSLGNSVDKRSF